MDITDYTDAWIAALRSGEFPQGKGTLCQNGKFCCLGVGAKITDDLVGPDVEGDKSYVLISNGYDKGARWHDEPPSRVRGKLGLNPQETSKLMTANDELGYTFEQIADILEQAKVDPDAILDLPDEK